MKKFLFPLILVALGVLLFVAPSTKEIAAGIAILLFGMIMLEEGFNSMVSGTLRNLLKKATDKVYKSIGLGFLSTAILQSSSLTSVIVISFLSAGLIELRAGIGIIFGSNIGTTATAWLVSQLGLKLDISSMAMPLLIFGIVLFLQKNKSLKGVGQVLAGLGFFFMGIFFMKNGFDIYKDSIHLQDFAVSGIKGLFIFTLLGVLLTVVLQSSSATMALILTALAAEQITYTNSLALAIGANIGTTITAVIGSLSANVAGKRLAGAHFIFNIFTGFIALLFINQLGDLVDFIALHTGITQQDYILKLSIFHSIFNLLGLIVMLPFIDTLVRVLTHIIPEKETKDLIELPIYLDKNALTYPPSALEALSNESKRLFEKMVFEIVAHGLHIHQHDILSEDKAKNIVQKSREKIDLNIQEVYLQKVKTIYSTIIEYATLAQSQLPPSPELTREFARIKLANRKMVEVIKTLADIHSNINLYLVSDNEHIQNEYDRLRKKIVKVLRALYALQNVPSQVLQSEKQERLERLEVLKNKTLSHDLLLDDSLGSLIQNQLITSNMATSLVNDSYSVNLISKRLIEVGELLYIQNDTILVDDKFQMTNNK